MIQRNEIPATVHIQDSNLQRQLTPEKTISMIKQLLNQMLLPEEYDLQDNQIVRLGMNGQITERVLVFSLYELATNEKTGPEEISHKMRSWRIQQICEIFAAFGWELLRAADRYYIFKK